MKNAIVKLGFCLLFLLFAGTVAAADFTATVTKDLGAVQHGVTFIDYNVVFGASVTDFADTDITLSGPGAAGATASIHSGSGTTYVVRVTGMTTTGDVKVQILQDAVHNGPDKNNDSNIETVTYDGNPGVTVSGTTPSVNSNPVKFIVTFDEEVTDFSASTPVSFTGSGASMTGLSVQSVNATTPDKVFEVFVNVPAAGRQGENIKLTVSAGGAHDADGNGNNVSNQYTIVYGGTAPAVTITSVTPQELDFTANGNVTNDGGFSNIVRGTVWKLNSSPGSGDNLTPAAGTGGGPFSQLRNEAAIDAERHYYVRTYANNGVGGVVLSPTTLDVWTWSELPTKSTDVTLTVQSTTSIRVQFEDFNPADKTDGIAVFRKTGGPFTTADFKNGKEPVVGSPDMPSIIYVTTNQVVNELPSFDTGLTPGTTYYYAAIPFNWDGTHTETYRFMDGFTQGSATTFSASSILVVTSTPTLAYATKVGASISTATDGLSIADITLYDGDHVTDDGDALPTNLQKVKFHIDNANMLNAIALLDNATVHAGTIDGSGNVEFTLLTGELQTLDNNQVSGGSPEQFNLIATFNKNTVSEGAAIRVTFVSAEVFSGSSEMAGSFPFDTGTNNKIEVTATKLVFTNPVAPINPNSDFELTVTAKDANDVVDKNLNGTVTLSKTSGGGTFSSADTPGGLARALGPNTGIVTWSLLELSDSGSKDIKATHSGGLSATTTLNVISLGVTPTGPTASACISNQALTDPNTFLTLGAIVIQESDRADFAIGSNVTFNLALPDGFVFDTRPAANPLVVSSGTDISTTAVFSGYVNNNVVKIKYTVSGSGGATKDQITISNLKVKYTGDVAATAKPILRVGGTAVIDGDSEDDAKPHGTLSAGVGTIVPAIKVNQSGFDPDQTAFSRVSDPPITLIGVKFSDSSPLNAAGVAFSGDGMVFQSGAWKFVPAALENGTHDVTIIFSNPDPDTNGQVGCVSEATKTFTVFASIINGLETEYCVNETPTPLTTPVDVPNLGTCTNILTLATENIMTGAYTYKYRELSTGTYVPLPSQTLFDPASPEFADEAAAPPPVGKQYPILEVGVFYALNTGCGYAPETFWAYGQVDLIPKPATSFGPSFPWGVCASDSPYDLTGSPYTPSNGYDEFWVTAVGNPNGTHNDDAIDGDRLSPPWKFVPGGANPTASDVQVQINYRHQDLTTGCTNTVSQVVDVWRTVPAIPGSNISVRGATDTSAEFCKNENITLEPFSIITPGTKWYKWYDAPGTSQVEVEGATQFNLVVPKVPGDANGPFVGTTTFNVTQTEHRQTTTIFGFPLLLFAGCEGAKTPITVQIFDPPQVAFAPSPVTATVICEGNKVDLTKLHASITPVIAGTWSSPGGGTFRNNSNGVDTDLADAVTYEPTNAEYLAGSFNLIVTSIDPAGPCGASSNFITITVNPGATVSFPVSPVAKCAVTDIEVTGSVTSAVAVTYTWSIVPGFGVGSLKPGTESGPVVVYQPHSSELNAGGLIRLKITTSDPDDAGPCDVASNTVDLALSQPARLDAGADFDVCADGTIVLKGVKPPGASSATNWTWTTTGGGTITNPNALNTTYIPAPAENPGPQDLKGFQALTFTLTSDAPGGTNVCPGQSDDVIGTLHYTPKPPSLVAPRTYCVGDAVDLFRADPSPTASVAWYSADPEVDPASQIIIGTNTLASPEDAAVEKQVKFYATQFFDRDMPAFEGCESTASFLTVVVNPNPVANFSYVNQCLGDFLEITNLSTLQQPAVGSREIVAWEWNFDDTFGPLAIGAGPIPAGTQDDRTIGTYKEPQHQYKNPGEYNIFMKITTSDNCTATVTKTGIKIGAIPVPDFSIAKTCEDDDTRYAYTGTATSDITQYAWDFDDPGSGGDNTSSIGSPIHQFSGVGTYNVSLHVETDLGCFGDLTKATSILPYVKTFPYIENFESSSHGWVPEGTVYDVSGTFTANSWNLLTSAGSIQSDTDPNSGPTFWATHTSGLEPNFYYNNERSVIYGPCVDMSLISRPVVAIDYFNDTEKQGDGVYIEYKDEDENGNGTWKRLGDTEAGLNWYTSASVGGLSLLGDVGQVISQLGWSGTTDNWTTGRFNLDQLVGTKRLRFRVVFGSNFSPVNTDLYDGFAFDYFKVESRNRLVLIENFTSGSSAGAVVNNSLAFKNFPSEAATKEVVKIEYHTGLPGTANEALDSIFLQNRMDPNARASFYGLSAVPRGFIDGYSDLDVNGTFSDAWAAKWYSKESLKTSPITININTPTITDGIINITGTVTADEGNLPANTYSLYIAVVEEKATSLHTYVLRKMLPSASGIKVPLTPKGASFTFDESWSIDKAYLSDDPRLIAVAFVQSDIVNIDGERVVLQAAYNDNISGVTFTTGLEVPFLEQTAIYPNPADNLVTIELPRPTNTGVQVRVIDQLGRPVIEKSIGVGDNRVTIDTDDLAGSVYIIQLNENGMNSARKLVVTHHR